MCVTSTNYGEDSFVGICFEENKKRIVFPLGYRIPEDNNECRISILNLLKLISLFKNNILGSMFGIRDGAAKELPINSFLWVINDYLTNGAYFDIEKKYVQNRNGKINWKKTLNSKFYISNNSIIYLNPFVEKKVTEKNYITNIHLFCVNKSIREIGWLFGNIECPRSNINEFNLLYYKNLLNREMLKTFDDRKKQLILHMKRILDYTTDSNQVFGEKKYGTNEFEYIWQNIIDNIFGNENINKYFPRASWNILNWNKIEDSKLKPDTVLSVENKLYILDSKYYKFGTNGHPMNLPHTDSIQKQITYGEYARNNTGFEEIYNAFIVPYNKENNKFNINGDIEYVGFAESNWKNKNNSHLYEHVALILIDTKYAIDKYFECTNGDINELVGSIQKVVKTFPEIERL